MFRIYVSSTYLDLVGERRAARDAIHGLGHYAVGMENYSASDQRPLDRCLQDVRSCQAYVGIFAWRYGFRPGGGQRSITQLEYEEAKSRGIPCFLFLLDENAPWPRSRVPDDEQLQIKALRSMLGAEHLVTYFQDATTLAHAVTQSLANGMKKPTNPSIPDILPYLCDRSEQEFALREVIRRLDPKRPHPVACLVHGEETEAHDKFLERLQKVIIPLLLPKETVGCVLSYRLEWPGIVRSAGDIRRRLEASLSKEVLASVVGTRQAVNIQLAKYSTPLIIHSHLITENWEQQGKASLDAFFRFWQEWPELSVAQRLFVFLFVKYQTNSTIGSFRLRRYRRLNAELRAVLEKYDFRRSDRLIATVLPELKGPTLSETQDWARSKEVSKFCDTQALVTALSNYYAIWESQQKERVIPVRIPTDQLIPELVKFISQAELKERIS